MNPTSILVQISMAYKHGAVIDAREGRMPTATVDIPLELLTLSPSPGEYIHQELLPYLDKLVAMLQESYERGRHGC